MAQVTNYSRKVENLITRRGKGGGGGEGILMRGVLKLFKKNKRGGGRILGTQE